MVGRKRPPLPAPTESSIHDDPEEPTGSATTYVPDYGTDLSQRTDRSSYSIPEDGRPLTLPTKKIRTERSTGPTGLSETSLLIEYYEGDKSGQGPQSRPSVRVKVSPHARRLSREAGEVKITEVRSSRQPSRTDRIPLDLSRGTTSDPEREGASELSARSPIEVELLNKSEMDSEVGTKNVALPSDVSSMPPDSMLDGPPAIKVPDQDDSTPTSPEKPRDAGPRKRMVKATLKAPKIERTRSKSTERITQKAIEKLQREQGEEPPTNKTSKIRPKSGGSDSIAASDRVRSKRSSRSQRDSDLRSGTESSLLPNRDVESNISSGSKISINNPKLLATVEDAIRRLILPEIETIKRNQSVRSTRTRDSFISDDSLSRSGTNQRLSKSTSEAHVKDKGGADDSYGDYALGNSSRRRKHRTSGHGSVSSRQDSVDSITREKERARKHRPRLSNDSNLTRENLRSQDSRSSVVSDERDRRRNRNRDRRESDSIAQTDDEYYEKQSTIPPMPMASEIQDSELTRDSLLSVETTDSIDEERANAVPQTARQVPIIKEVNRASPNTVESPISRTTIKSPATKEGASPDAGRSKDNRSLKSSRSDRSIGSNKKAAAYAAAGLGAAAAGLYAHSGSADDKDASGRMKRASSKEKSRESSPRRIERKTSSDVKPSHKKSPLSKESLASSVDYPLTQKRHQGINLEREAGAPESEETGVQRDDQDAVEGDDSFYEKQRQLNDEYRSSVGYDSHRDSTDTNPWRGLTPGESPYKIDGIFENVLVGQQVRGVGANAEVVQTPMQAESAIASLAGDSVTSLPSRSYEQRSKNLSRDAQAQAGQDSPEKREPGLHTNTSAERWNAIRGHAQALSQGTLSMSDSGSVNELNQPRPSDIHISATGGPVAHPMPEAEYIYDDQSDLTDHRAQDRNTPSVVEGRLGDEYENQGLWPYEPTPDIESRRGGIVLPDDGERSPESVRGSAAIMGATGAGLGIGAATALALGAHGDKPSLPSAGLRNSARSDPYSQQRSPDHAASIDRQALDNKDEGYVTGDPGRSVGGETPLSFSKPPPKLFDERDQDYGAAQDFEEDRMSTPRNRKHLSVNSHGIPAEGYDAATGTGIDHIESKDVVALMDHLTVRDGHRNARDTEILVTLVRSAAEMRDSFDEMKKFIETQNQATIKRSDQTTQSVLSKFMSEARSLPASARNIRSVSGLSESDEAPGKKQNIFKRALKGLGSRNEKDLSKMENMLMQLLGEVEALRASHNAATIPVPSLAQSRGLDSYERLRAAADSGYEPEGHAGTSSTTGMTATPSTQPRGQRMHSGYSYNRDSGNRPISTVHEGDEDVAAYDDNERMLTPTQENQRGLGVNYHTPPSAGKQFHSQFTPTTPKTGERRSRQQSTSSSMFGGIPKISRWSKTTTSSAGEGRPSFQNDRPYSEASRSGSDVNVLPGEQGTYEPNEDDRLRSATSLARDREYDDVTPGRAESPTMEDDRSAEDPKYRANRHSLTLQHPQPRQGSAHRHPPHLEDQAQTYHHRNASRSSQGSQASSVSPQNDVFGSVPGLAKNRLSTATADATSRRSSARDDEPLIPSKDQRRYYDSQSRSGGGGGGGGGEGYDDDDQDSYDSLEDAHYRRTSGRTHGNDGAYESPSGGRYDDDYDSLDSDVEGERLDYDDEEDDGGHYYPPPIPMDRPRSPYSPGGLLEPIEERYSLEQSRISSPMSRRDTLNSKKTSRIEEEEEPLPERLGSPDVTPRPAVGAQGSPDGRRKITGPREMPHARSASGGLARKPVAGN